MARIPTDLKILRVIYDRYYENFRAYSKKNGERMDCTPMIGQIGLGESGGVPRCSPH
jgi:hypothetical protein